MCSLNKVYECYTEEQESKFLNDVVKRYADKIILFRTPPETEWLVSNAIYIEFQHKGVAVPWYIAVYEVLPKNGEKEEKRNNDET